MLVGSTDCGFTRPRVESVGFEGWAVVAVVSECDDDDDDDDTP
jgi:hypothetical protein